MQTLGLGNGFNLKAGRFLSGVGYLNEMHPHEWDFSNAPLPYQAFFGNALGMDGVQARWLAPTPIFLEFGAETARAMSFPATDESKSKNGLMSASAFVHLGGDFGASNSWRGGLSYFAAQAKDRSYEDPLNQINNSFSGASRTFVVADANERVYGYYAMAAGAVSHQVANSQVRRNMPDPIPVVILGRLAIDAHYQGKGIGVALLQDAVVRTAQAAEILGIRGLLVHAISEDAKKFYEHHGFIASPTQPMTLILSLKIKK